METHPSLIKCRKEKDRCSTVVLEDEIQCQVHFHTTHQRWYRARLNFCKEIQYNLQRKSTQNFEIIGMQAQRLVHLTGLHWAMTYSMNCRCILCFV